ncbi:MAG: malto-oligosyltrehalose trehalohydrolase, partial [Bacteroidales bacterium]
MNSDLINHRSLGINFFSGEEPIVKVWAPYAKQLTLKTEGKKDVHLKKMKYGYWQENCPEIKPGDKYLLQIDNKESFPDPASLSQPLGIHDSSEVIDLNEIRKINSENRLNHSLAELIIYELHIGTFTQEGTFKAATEKLDYLKDLGVNAIELMPLVEFPGKRNWGYDGVCPFAVHHAYGGIRELANLVKACHDRGIAVILDVVYNHLGPEGNYLEKFGPFLTNNYKTPWGKAINFDDAWCDGVRNYFIENALMWLRDLHIDGLRLDAIHAIKDFSPQHFLSELSEYVEELNKETDSSHFLIAESDLNDVRVIKPINENGFGMDAQWCDDWHHSLHSLLTGEKKSYYLDFGTVEHLAKSFNNAFVYDGCFSGYRKKYFGTSTKQMQGDKFIVYTQNHDQTGNRPFGERLSTLIEFEKLKLAAGALFFSPFTPMIFMGEEYGEESPFLYFTSHEDEKLAQKITQSRKRDFFGFLGK